MKTCKHQCKPPDDEKCFIDIKYLKGIRINAEKGTLTISWWRGGGYVEGEIAEAVLEVKALKMPNSEGNGSWSSGYGYMQEGRRDCDCNRRES